MLREQIDKRFDALRFFFLSKWTGSNTDDGREFEHPQWKPEVDECNRLSRIFKDWCAENDTEDAVERYDNWHFDRVEKKRELLKLFNMLYDATTIREELLTSTQTQRKQRKDANIFFCSTVP